MERPDEKDVDAAKAVLRRDYWASVRQYADDLEEAVKDGDIANRDDFIERLDETVDGSYWVIYTHAELQVLCWTENDSAYFDEMGDSLECEGDPYKAYQLMAYYALRADILSYLKSVDDLFERRDQAREEMRDAINEAIDRCNSHISTEPEWTDEETRWSTAIERLETARERYEP